MRRFVAKNPAKLRRFVFKGLLRKQHLFKLPVLVPYNFTFEVQNNLGLFLQTW